MFLISSCHFSLHSNADPATLKDQHVGLLGPAVGVHHQSTSGVDEKGPILLWQSCGTAGGTAGGSTGGSWSIPRMELLPGPPFLGRQGWAPKLGTPLSLDFFLDKNKFL